MYFSMLVGPYASTLHESLGDMQSFRGNQV